MPFTSVAEKFHLIDSPTVTIYLPIGEGASLVNDLLHGGCNRALYRKLGQYAVNIYPQHLRALQDAGAVEPVDDTSFRLVDTNLYDQNTGLQLDVETGQGFFV